MAIKQRDYQTERGRKDAARHREKQREAIKKNLPEIIADTPIITHRRGQIVKIPLRGIKSYYFKHGSRGVGFGIGQGKEKVGDVIGRKPAQGQQPGRAGDQPGIDYIETEIDIEELIEMMLEDLGLPNFEKKEVAELEVLRGWKIRNIDKAGLRPNLERKRTLRQGIKRYLALVEELKKQTGKSDKECRIALNLAIGEFNEALKILRDSRFQALEESDDYPIITRDDLRFRTLEEDIDYQSHAVVLAMMDVSGSMTTMKKYFARSFFFWLIEFLKKIYKKVEIRFIAHHTEAKLVDEDTFFHKGESGGTFCWSAYQLAGHLVDTQYPTNRWNVYAFHFSDGEDWEAERTVEEVKKLLARKVNMLGYGEIQTGSYIFSNLMKAFKKQLSLEEKIIEGMTVVSSKSKETPFLGVVITDRAHIYLSLKEFLKKERW